MAILFISGLQANRGQSDSGGNALQGIAEALCKYANDDVELVSHPSVQSFPRGPLWVGGSKEATEDGHVIQFLPTLNIKIVKSIFWGKECNKIIKIFFFYFTKTLSPKFDLASESKLFGISITDECRCKNSQQNNIKLN